ncbi:hypothetical protein, partial [Planotetraspora phitsanulokensis]|uniref:hypothetical protein n=1 Tax=Planotetraspora phitsanulokensis TaxID=575192 RepID=UPI001950908C
DTNAGNSFTRYDGNGVHVQTGTPFHAAEGTFVVLREPVAGGAARTGWLEDLGGVRLQRDVAELGDGALRVEFAGGTGPRHGEFTVYDSHGAITQQGFNVLRDGRATPYQYVVTHTPGGGGTWVRAANPHAGRPPADAGASGVFNAGKAEVSPDGSRVRLLTDNKVEVFDRRPLPGGGALDSFRRTGTVGFGRFTRRTTWVHWDDAGGLLNHGTRRYDTSGFSWTDVDHRGRDVHAYRDGLQKFKIDVAGKTESKAGHIFAVKGEGGRWRWHRYDAAGNEVATGERTTHFDGGWSDHWTNADGQRVLAQKQWGPMHAPENAGHYLEHKWDAAKGGVQDDLWERQSPHGKDAGKVEKLPDQGLLTTTRWSEQRPPLWARKVLIRAATPGADVGHLAGDRNFQIYLWTKEGGSGAGGGVRYVGMDGGVVDLAGDGSFVRSVTKLHNGDTLKVGDVAVHDLPPTANLPWQDGRNTGYRVPVDAPTAGRGGEGLRWQDRFQGVDGNWKVAREGFGDGSVREYVNARQVDPATGQWQGGTNGSWVQRDAHGNVTGVSQTWDGVDGQVVGLGTPDSSAWRWRANGAEGDRFFFRGSDDPRLPWDDSFRDFDGTGNLIREQNMLDGGKHVQAWKVETNGAESWHVNKFDKSGNLVSYGDGQQVRRLWWNPEAQTWDAAWSPGRQHWRDVIQNPGSDDVVVREVPPHLSMEEGPLRVREYRPDAKAPTPGAWKEFDHGSVVRERTSVGGGVFLEKDAWRGQWRRYDADGQVIAQRTDNGLVFEGGPDHLRLTGNEYDFRGPVTELRGWGRRIREANRLPWGETMSVERTAALDGLHGLPAEHAGRVVLGEAKYESYLSVLAKKVALEFGQEFILEFGANLAVNGIVAEINNKPFTGKDALKAFANAAVSAGVKGVAGTVAHEIRGQGITTKAVWSNVDGGKHWTRHPNNHDKTWANEWAGNETATRWRGGTYDFGFGVGTSVIAGFINGSMNAAVWGVTGPDGQSHILSGAGAVGEGGISMLSALTTASSAGVVKNLAVFGLGGRGFHRQGFGEFWVQLGFKIGEKTFNSWLSSTIRNGINPWWLQTPPNQQ